MSSWNRWCVASVLGLALFLGAPLAQAQQRWIVSGTLDESDPESRIIEVAERMYQLTATTRIKVSDDSLGTWQDIVAREGRHVSLLVRPGHPHARVYTILLADDDSDG